ncbi:hypothetical protein DBV39_01550 [Orrella marina]|uniref:Uncharacterized protein n=1 Tax=Orrella marina TaxID=2163011 RepID=A0A2R4XFN9_9BURK|nr:hypothetical protein DBV39_01550 [Orrella marina]
MSDARVQADDNPAGVWRLLLPDCNLTNAIPAIVVGCPADAGMPGKGTWFAVGRKKWPWRIRADSTALASIEQ